MGSPTVGSRVTNRSPILHLSPLFLSSGGGGEKTTRRTPNHIKVHTKVIGQQIRSGRFGRIFIARRIVPLAGFFLTLFKVVQLYQRHRRHHLVLGHWWRTVVVLVRLWDLFVPEKVPFVHQQEAGKEALYGTKQVVSVSILRASSTSAVSVVQPAEIKYEH